MPNLNSGIPWSEMSDRDLRWCFEQEWPIEQVADFLCRGVHKIEQRVRELGLLEARGD